MKSQVWMRFCRMVVVVRGLLEPAPWRWGRIELRWGPTIEYLGRWRMELVFGRPWLRFGELRANGTIDEVCRPLEVVAGIKEMSEEALRREVLPDPEDRDAQDRGTCEVMVLPSCRPGRCARCGGTDQEHRRFSTAAFNRERELREKIAAILSKKLGYYLVWPDVRLVWDGAEEDAAQPPGSDRILDVRVRQHPNDTKGERISRDDWDRLMNAGIPLYPWTAAQQAWELESQ